MKLVTFLLLHWHQLSPSHCHPGWTSRTVPNSPPLLHPGPSKPFSTRHPEGTPKNANLMTSATLLLSGYNPNSLASPRKPARSASSPLTPIAQECSRIFIVRPQGQQSGWRAHSGQLGKGADGDHMGTKPLPAPLRHTTFMPPVLCPSYVVRLSVPPGGGCAPFCSRAFHPAVRLPRNTTPPSTEDSASVQRSFQPLSPSRSGASILPVILPLHLLAFSLLLPSLFKSVQAYMGSSHHPPFPLIGLGHAPCS